MFKDYYSILGVSYPSSSEEIHQAYNAKIGKLGEESSKESSPNYTERVDVEEAFRVIGASYRLKIAYDEEYAQYLASEDKDNFSIQNDWTITEIDHERAFVINRILQNGPKIQNEDDKKGFGGKVLGCFLKIIGVFFILLLFAGIKNCSRQQARKALVESYTESNYSQNNNSTSYSQSNSSAELKLQKTAREINQSLPRRIDDNITQSAISLTESALVYVYLIDDDYFEMMRDQALSSANQLANIRAMYSDMKPMIDLLVQTHRGISYKYICKNSKETNIVEVPCTDLASL